MHAVLCVQMGGSVVGREGGRERGREMVEGGNYRIPACILYVVLVNPDVPSLPRARSAGPEGKSSSASLPPAVAADALRLISF